jgi:hypothetical protein
VDHEQRWLDDQSSKRRVAPKKTVTVEARYVRQFNGGHYATVTVDVEPSDRFEITFDTAVEANGQYAELIDAFALGFLDVAWVALPSSALTLVRLRIRQIDTHPLDSTPWAFRMAGRAAGRRMLELSEGFGRDPLL